jgi:predicted transglutaminase-like cysteine proteinase
LTALLAQSRIQAAEPRFSEPFGLSTEAAKEGPWWLVWNRLQAQMLTEAPVIARCYGEPAACSSSAGERFAAILKEGEGKQGVARIAHINRAVNLSFRFKEGTPWSSPLETLSNGIGDCKHYALIKYAALNISGWKLEDLQIVMVKIKSAQVRHMVLAVREDGRWLILDNRTSEVVNSIDLGAYEPLYVFDYRGMRQFVVSGAPQIAGAACHRLTG